MNENGGFPEELVEVRIGSEWCVETVNFAKKGRDDDEHAYAEDDKNVYLLLHGNAGLGEEWQADNQECETGGDVETPLDNLIIVVGPALFCKIQMGTLRGQGKYEPVVGDTDQ